MRTEVPICRRCCFCMPLRYGLLFWGYFSFLPVSLFLIIDLYKLVVAMTAILYMFHWVQTLVIFISFVQNVVYFLLSFVLIVALHKKNAKWLKVYKIAALVCAVINLTLTVVVFLMVLSRIRWLAVFTRTALEIPYFSLQFYIVALVRSEIIKLESSVKFQFSNLAASAENAYYGQYDPQEEDTQEKGDTTADSDDTKEDSSAGKAIDEQDEEQSSDGNGTDISAGGKADIYVNSEIGEGKTKKKTNMLKTPIHVMGKSTNYDKVVNLE